jgi:Ni/Fe-hydrogenase b-type cytochrome subunit
MHWVSVACIVVLAVTGFYIGRPYFFTGGEPSDHFLMGRFRFVHFVAAGVLVATALLRVYWLFIGNKFERWDALFPVRREDWRNMRLVLKRYLFIDPWRAPHYLGHNPLQQITYLFVYLVAIVQILTGFYMDGLADPGGFFFTWFAWVGTFLGGAQVTLRADVVHQESRISSMVGGGRYVRADIQFVDD